MSIEYLKGMSGKTETTYTYAITSFLKTVYSEGTLEENVSRYFTDNRNYEQDVQNFQTSIKDRPPTSIRTMLSGVKIFLMENNVELSQSLHR